MKAYFFHCREKCDTQPPAELTSLKPTSLPKLSALIIAGPTASGKSSLALRLARALNGVIINADSMQVYRDLRILSARPHPDHEAIALHRLYGHIDGAVNYSVGRWLADIAPVLEEVRGAGHLPIIVGGTGLYFKALMQGLSAIPQVSSDVRRKVRAESTGLPASELHARLKQCDPAIAARLRPTDPQRILRALEVFEATGQSLLSFQRSRTLPLLEANEVFAVFLRMERKALKERVASRVDAMVHAGALEEVARLRELGYDSALPIMRALGVPHLIAYLNGEIPLADAARLVTSDSVHYAKRQETFARNQLITFEWLAPEEAEACALRHFA